MPPHCRCQLSKHKSALRWSTGVSATCFPHSYYKMALQSPYAEVVPRRQGVAGTADHCSVFAATADSINKDRVTDVAYAANGLSTWHRIGDVWSSVVRHQ